MNQAEIYEIPAQKRWQFIDYGIRVRFGPHYIDNQIK